MHALTPSYFDFRNMLLSLFDSVRASVPDKSEEIQLAETDFQISVNEENIPVRILFETRFNNRVSVNKNGILLRIDTKQNKDEQRKQIDYLLKWAKQKIGDKPELLDSLPQRRYVNGEVLKVGSYDFVISIFYNDQNKSTAKIFKNNILLSLAKGLQKEVEENTSSYLVAKCLSKFFQPIVQQRIRELNDRFFKRELKTVKVKYATSFWGHCSTSGNIVISLRLMFAPQKIVDYVYVHELAHLIHHNHSASFWKVVKQVMPDYESAELYLKNNSNQFYL